MQTVSHSAGASWHQLAASSGISRDSGWSWRHTLASCIELGFERCQIYVGQELMESAEERSACAQAFADAKISVTCHSPGLFTADWAREEYLLAFDQVLAHEPVKKIIVHHEGSVPLGEQLDLVERFNQRGLVVCLENYYQEYSPDELVRSLASWGAVLVAGAVRGLALEAVIDLPRLYIGAFRRAWPGDLAAAQLFASVAQSGLPLILHCIDCSNDSQDRGSWCVLGQGLVPHSSMYHLAGSLGVILDHIVLEYEDPVLFKDSIETAAQYTICFHVQKSA